MNVYGVQVADRLIRIGRPPEVLEPSHAVELAAALLYAVESIRAGLENSPDTRAEVVAQLEAFRRGGGIAPPTIDAPTSSPHRVTPLLDRPVPSEAPAPTSRGVVVVNPAPAAPTPGVLPEGEDEMRGMLEALAAQDEGAAPAAAAPEPAPAAAPPPAPAPASASELAALPPELRAELESLRAMREGLRRFMESDDEA